MTDWDKIWKERDGVRLGSPELSFVRFARRVFGQWIDGKRFLDVGSGVGANTIWLEQQGAEVIAIDPSHECRAHYHYTLYEYWFEITQRPTFDCILDIKTLCHNEDAAVDYVRIHQILKPGGWLYVMAPSIDHLSVVHPVYRDVGKGKDFTRYASEWDMRKMLRNFSTVSVRELKEPAGDHLYTSTWCVEAQK